MPTNLQMASFVLGAVLLLVAILGGNFKLFTAEVLGTVGTAIRWVAGLLGLGFIALAFVLPTGDRQPIRPPSNTGPAPTPTPTSESPTQPPNGAGTAALEPGRDTAAPQPPTPAPAPTPTTAPETHSEAVAAMQWIESRCGPGIELIVPNPPGSAIDRAARAFATAIGNSGVRPIPIVANVPGVFYASGSFSVQKFDDWYRGHGVKEACLLAIVPADVREQFAKPRVDAVLADKTYGIVLPRGVVAEAASRWNTIFDKASNDPDFAREIEMSGLRVSVVH